MRPTTTRQVICGFLLLASSTTALAASEQATFISQTVPTRIEAGKSYDVSVAYKNTGSEAWNPKQALVLRSIANDSKNTWGIDQVNLGDNETIPPGESKVFSFRITAPKAAGQYAFQWGLQHDAIALGEPTPAVKITVDDAAPAAQFVSQLLPDGLEAGGTYRATVQFRNNGKTTWSDASDIHLAASPTSKGIWGIDRVAIAAGAAVLPGEIATFGFNVTAPTKAGIYPFQWQVAQKDGSAIGEGTPVTNVVIASSGTGQRAEFVYQKVLTKMKIGESHRVTIVMKNTGGHPWRAGEIYLMPQNPANNLNWATDRVDLNDGELIKPGEVKTFAFTVRAPNTQSIYPFEWQLYKEGEGWFGDRSEQVDIQVYR